MPVSDIASAFHLTQSSIYRRLDKAQQMLKKTLERWDSLG